MSFKPTSGAAGELCTPLIMADHIQMGVSATDMQDHYNAQSMNKSMTIDDPAGTIHRSMAPHKPVGRSASMVPLSQRSMDPDKHKKPSEKPPEWRSKSLAAVSAPAPEAFPDLPDDKDGSLLQHAMAHINSLRQENQELRSKLNNGLTSRSSQLSSARSSFRGSVSSRPTTAAGMSSLPSQRSSTPFLDTMRSLQILEEAKAETPQASARSGKILSTRRSQKIGTKWMLERGVPRAKTPMEKMYLPPAMRSKLPEAIPLLSKEQPPGVQRLGQQRGAGEQGAMRIGRSCINFDPCGVTRDHQISVEQSFINRAAIGCPPSRDSTRGPVVQHFDGTFRRATPKPKKKKT